MKYIDQSPKMKDDLQRLNDIPMDKLRPEFLSQTLGLRESLFSKAKSKKMHGQEISGAVLAGLAQEYVRAINGGAVPNIESAWTYVCSAQRDKLQVDLVNEFERELEELISGKVPIEEEELNQEIKSLSRKIKKRFATESLDGVDHKESARFKQVLKVKADNCKDENAQVWEVLVERLLEEGFYDKVENHLQELERIKALKKKTEIKDNRRGGLLNDTETHHWVEDETKTWADMAKKFSRFLEESRVALGTESPRKLRMLYSFLYR